MSYVIDPNGVMISLAEFGLLSDDRVEELTRLGHQDESPSDEMILGYAKRRGWLSPWQCEQVRNGRIAHLRFGEFVLTDFVHRDKNDRIFEARSLEDGRRVALKVLTSQSQADPLIVHRLKRDLEVSHRIGSPWAVRCEGIESYQGRSCLIREWVDGMTLRRFIETHGRFDRKQVVPFMLELARGLRAIHSAGYRHGAIRSDRIMVRPDGKPVWFDFGQASEIGAKDQNLAGSAAYRELEHASHAPAGDIRTDAYFLGCIFYELLSGISPHPELEHGQELQTLMVRTFGSEIPLADISNPPKPEISRTVARMMAFRPEIRLAAADDIIQCFERIEKGLEPETRAEPVEPSAAIDTAELYAWLNGAEPKETSEDSPKPEEPQVTGNRPIALEHQVDRNVLCVEAQEEIQRELRKTFDKLGWKSRMVRTTDTAADMARDKPADIIVYDADGQGRDSLDAFFEIDRICSLGRPAPAGLLLLGPKQLKLEATLNASIRQRYTILRKPLKMRDVKNSLLACAIQK